MAQKADARTMRRNIVHPYTHAYVTSPNRYTPFLQKQLLTEDFISRFYKKSGYEVLNFNMKLNSSVDAYYHLRLLPELEDLSPRHIRGDGSKKAQNSIRRSNNFYFTRLIPSKANLQCRKRDFFYTQYLWKNKQLFRYYCPQHSYFWNAEKHVLSKILYRINRCYPILIKTNIWSKFLSTNARISCNSIAHFLKQQIELSSKRRKSVNLKTYLDSIIQESRNVASLKGMRIQVKGRFSAGGSNKAGRSKKDNSSWGQVPLQTIRAHIDYAYVPAKTKLGLCGVKVWLYHRHTKYKIDHA